MIKKFPLLAALISCFLSSNAQTSFSVSTTEHNLRTFSDAFVVYNFVQFTNTTSKPIEMRWERTNVMTFPDGWIMDIQAPDNAHRPATNQLEALSYPTTLMQRSAS